MSMIDYLPYKAKNDTLIQGRIPLELAREIKKMASKHNLSMSDVFISCFRQFLAEMNQLEAKADPRLKER